LYKFRKKGLFREGRGKCDFVEGGTRGESPPPSLYVKKALHFPCPKVGMSSFGTRLLGREKLSYTRANKTCQGKLVKEKLIGHLYNYCL
jgi:hypothetical protein